MNSEQASSPQQPYTLKFMPEALAEWQALDGSVKQAFKRLLQKRLENPHVPGSALMAELRGCYKIKLRKQGYRLIYSVEDGELVVLVLAIDKRERSTAYKSAVKRLLQR
ncbi:type II toxin-antitoxin system RelE/ParE family toxin [Vogesella amnigena]|uniref:Type II toxin-antitoxin system RelE/ParE family toxin n=1 Tax=Vogesella amnigena TaxID=1507449 RepID=A0ABV7TN72_9NEIS